MQKGFLVSCLVIWLCQNSAIAQLQKGERIDSLLAILQHTQEDTIKVALYAEIMFAHIYYKPDKGMQYIRPALTLANKLNWEHGLAILKHRSARLCWRMGQFDQALLYHHEALDLYKKLGNTRLAGKVLIEIGQDYLDNGHLNEAKAALTEALDYNQTMGYTENMASVYDILAYMYEKEGNPAASIQAAYDYVKLSEKIGDKVSMTHSLYLLASNYQALGNNQEALKYHNQGLMVAIDIDDLISQFNFADNIGDIYLNEKNFAKALDHFSMALALAQEIDDPQMLAAIYRKLGKYYQQTGNVSEAMNNYEASARLFVALSHRQDLAGLYADMGTLHTTMKKYEEAEKYFFKAKKLYDGLDGKLSMLDYFMGKEKLDSATGKWQNAYNHHKEYIAIRDSMYNRSSLQKLVGAELRYDFEKKEMLAKAEQEKKDLLVEEEIKQQRKIRNVAIVILLGFILFSVITLYQRNKLAKEKKRSDKLLQDNELLLREIHHRVKNNLEVVSSLLALQSARILDIPTKNAMQESQNRVQSIGIVHQKLYQGKNLGAIEMKDYFLNLSENLLDSFGAEKRVTIECAMEKLDVDIDTAVPLGLIVNELLTNTLKYAFPDGKPGKVQIKLHKKQDGVLQMEVSDNGVGKSGITKGTGFGGQLVSLLTQQLNGTMKEELNEGTRIYFEFKAA